LPLRVNQA
jgi:tetratricopeptide (TPR) repeat protein